MKLSEYRKDADYYSSSASSINRSLSFSGIAIIWIFTQSTNNQIGIDKLLLFSLSLLALSLLFDLFQYCFGFYMWDSFHRKQELKAHIERGKIIEDEIDVLGPSSTKNIINFFFWTKIICNIIAYTLIIFFLFNKVFIN